MIKAVNPEMENHFRERINYHISLVRKYLDKIMQLRDPRIQSSIISAELVGHDQSKFNPPEYGPYLHINWKYLLKDKGQDYDPPEDIKKAMDVVTLHHIVANKHHPSESDRITVSVKRDWRTY